MSLKDFLEQKNEKLKGQMKSKTHDFKEKCMALLEQIREHNEERYYELLNVFKFRYDKVNIQKNKIMGFYAQLNEELNDLKRAANQIEKVTKSALGQVRGQTTKAVKEFEKEIDVVKKTTKKAASKVLKEIEEITKTTKKAAAKAKDEIEKVAKSVGKKKTKVTKITKKSTPKKAAKKVAKKAAKKVAKKTAKKTTKKKA